MLNFTNEKTKFCQEEVSIVDEENNILGKADRIIMRTYNLPHRATYVIIKNKSQKFLVQKRTMSKDYCPGHLDAMTGGCVQFNETYEENCLRETKEEMGIENVHFNFLGIIHYKDHGTNVFGGLFECEYNGKLILEKEEVEEVFEMSGSEILYRQNEFTPDSIYIFKEYLNIKNNVDKT